MTCAYFTVGICPKCNTNKTVTKILYGRPTSKAMKEAKAIDSIIVAHCEDESELQPGACINEGNYAKEHDLVGINNASEYNHAIRDLKLADEIKNRAMNISAVMMYKTLT